MLQVVEDESARRIEMLVQKRVEEELARRKNEIDEEVNRRVEATKAEMEKELTLELERRRELIREEERKREVNMLTIILKSVVFRYYYTDKHQPKKKEKTKQYFILISFNIFSIVRTYNSHLPIFFCFVGSI